MKTGVAKIFLLLIAVMAGAAVRAQTVDLKDGSGVVLSTHASITAAYAAIPATLTQAYVIELKTGYVSTTETFPITMVVKTGASAANTITIRPALGVTALSITGSSTALLRLDNADWIVVDGRPGGVGTTRALTFNQTSTGSTAYDVEMLNGATNNAFRWCVFDGVTTTGLTGSRCIYIGTSASNTSGNSDNNFEYLRFIGGRVSLNSSGTAANNNNNLRVYGCEFLNTRFAAFWGQAGTGLTTIDSNLFYSTTGSATGTTSTGCFGILYDAIGDTLVITRNKFYDFDNGTNTTPVFAISIRSFAAAASYSRIVNNFISLNSPNSTSDQVHAITYGYVSAANPHVADIFYNTVRIGGTATGGAAGNIGSSAFYFDATNAGSTYTLRNNIFANARTGGSESHVGMYAATSSGTHVRNHNTYDVASGDVARLGTTVYNSFLGYQTAVSPQEAASNATPVQFVSNTDLHLSGTSIGNANLAGIAVAGITTDIDGDARTTPYRGADEAASLTPCSGAPAAAAITTSNAAPCAGANFTLTASGQSAGVGISYYWQSRPAGSTGAWNAVAGATAFTLTTSVAAATEFRFVDSCALSQLATPSNVLVITPAPVPSVASITETHTGLQYTFTAVGAQNVTGYSWNFGDGSAASTLASPTHTYAAQGTYVVTLTVSNACGTATATLTVNSQPCSGAPASTGVFRSDSTLCIGVDTALLHVVYAGSDVPTAPFLTVQWQSSLNGTTGWTNMTGAAATNDSIRVSPLDTTYYRYILTCVSSGQSTTSNAVAIYTQPNLGIGAIGVMPGGNPYTFVATGLAGASSYIWSFGDGTPNGSGATVQHTYAAAGTYTVTLTVVGECGVYTYSTTVNATTGVADAAAAAGIVLYPNPAREEISIRSPVGAEEVTLLNATGAVVWKQQTAGRTEVSVNVRGLAAGTYIVRVQTARGTVHLPLQKL